MQKIKKFLFFFFFIISLNLFVQNVKSYIIYDEIQYSNYSIYLPDPYTLPVQYFYPHLNQTFNKTLYKIDFTFYTVMEHNRVYSLYNKTFKLISYVYINNINYFYYSSSKFEFYSTDLNESIIVYTISLNNELSLNDSNVEIKALVGSFGLDYYYKTYYTITLYMKYNYMPPSYSIVDSVLVIVPSVSISTIFPFVLKKFLANSGFSIGLLISTILLAISSMISIQYIILLTMCSIALIYNDIKTDK